MMMMMMMMMIEILSCMVFQYLMFRCHMKLWPRFELISLSILTKQVLPSIFKCLSNGAVAHDPRSRTSPLRRCVRHWHRQGEIFHHLETVGVVATYFERNKLLSDYVMFIH